MGTTLPRDVHTNTLKKNITCRQFSAEKIELNWEKTSSKTLRDSALEEAKRILKEYKSKPLEPDVDRELERKHTRNQLSKNKLEH